MKSQAIHHDNGRTPNGIVINLGRQERLWSLIGGLALALFGLSRPSLKMLATLGGSYLLYRGLNGRCWFYEALNINTANWSPAARPPANDGSLSPDIQDVVTEASLDSFPASDPPAWAMGDSVER